MPPLSVSIVSRDPACRLEAARAFDRAPAEWVVRVGDEPHAGADVVVVGPDVSGIAGIPFDRDNPGSLLDSINAATGRSGRLVAVTGASRGIGVTSVALHLAAAFARTGETTLVLDLDAEWEGAADRLGIEVPPLDVGSSIDARALRLAAAPVAGGFRLLNASPLAASPSAAGEVLTAVVPLYERVVLDLPASPAQAAILEAVGAVVVVVAPTVVGVGRTRRSLERWPDAPAALVANRLGSGGDMTIRTLARSLGRDILLELPCSPAVRDAEDRKALVGPGWSRWSRRIDLLARALQRV